MFTLSRTKSMKPCFVDVRELSKEISRFVRLRSKKEGCGCVISIAGFPCKGGANPAEKLSRNGTCHFVPTSGLVDTMLLPEWVKQDLSSIPADMIDWATDNFLRGEDALPD